MLFYIIRWCMNHLIWHNKVISLFFVTSFIWSWFSPNNLLMWQKHLDNYFFVFWCPWDDFWTFRDINQKIYSKCFGFRRFYVLLMTILCINTIQQNISITTSVISKIPSYLNQLFWGVGGGYNTAKIKRKRSIIRKINPHEEMGNAQIPIISFLFLPNQR